MQTQSRSTVYDVCIVGSGAGGGMAAYMLTKAGARVALLCGDELWRHCELPLQVARTLQNGGIPVQLVLGRVPG